jgi:hypothetical protein
VSEKNRTTATIAGRVDRLILPRVSKLLWEKYSRDSGTRMGFFMVHLLSGRTVTERPEANPVSAQSRRDEYVKMTTPQHW